MVGPWRTGWAVALVCFPFGGMGCADDPKPEEVALVKGACRSERDCTSPDGEACLAPIMVSALGGLCGVPCQVDDACNSNLECPNETPVCLPFLGNCCHAGDPVSQRCEATCVDSSLCGAGRRCSDSQWGCEPIPCDDGFTCPVHTTCRPEIMATQPRCATYQCRAGELEHGCARDTCIGDSDCQPAGRCVNGACFEAFGTCMGPVP